MQMVKIKKHAIQFKKERNDAGKMWRLYQYRLKSVKSRKTQRMRINEYKGGDMESSGKRKDEDLKKHGHICHIQIIRE